MGRPEKQRFVAELSVAASVVGLTLKLKEVLGCICPVPPVPDLWGTEGCV